MHIFLFNKSLRCQDNTTLIEQTIKEKSGGIIPIFIFTEQVSPNKNKYFSSNSVQFMVESLRELAYTIKNKYKGKLYLFHSDNFINVFYEIIKHESIESIGTNYDYSPYARKRQEILSEFCNKYSIKFYMSEDHVLYNILDGSTLKKNKDPYTVFTPFKNNCMHNLAIRSVNKFIYFNFKKSKILELSKFKIKVGDLDKFYNYNSEIVVRGGRKNALQILRNRDNYKDYSKYRDYLTYKTTNLAAHNHFGTVSIREVYNVFRHNKGIVNELHWRDFYYNLYYYYPYMLGGQVGSYNQPFKSKFNKVRWSNNNELFKKWANGSLGIPICDAGMRQLNKTGFMHNRLRMVTASIVTKLLLIDWRLAERYFAQKLVDYDCIQNSGGWGWTCTGIDPQQIFRIFNPYIQSKKFDPDATFIKLYIPELKDVPASSIHKWDTEYENYSNINYPKPQIDYAKFRKIGLREFSRASKNS
jgi:deoxyribodipyrimidine photo-lyase